MCVWRHKDGKNFTAFTAESRRNFRKKNSRKSFLLAQLKHDGSVWWRIIKKQVAALCRGTPIKQVATTFKLGGLFMTQLLYVACPM